MPNRIAERKEPVSRGTGNVFADLGFHAAERRATLRLAYALNQVLEERKLSQADPAKVPGTTQRKVSALRHYKLAVFSPEQLMKLLAALDQDVEAMIRRQPRSGRPARITVATWLLPSIRMAEPDDLCRHAFHVPICNVSGLHRSSTEWSPRRHYTAVSGLTDS